MVRNIHSVAFKPVQMTGAHGVDMAVMVGRDDQAPNFAMRCFDVQPGGNTPRHSHDYEHEVYVVSGSGSVLLHGKEQPISQGDTMLVPADEEHQFRAGEEGLRFLCMVPMTRSCGEPTPGS